MTLSAPGHDDPDTSPGATRQPPSLLGAVKDLTSLLTALVGLLAVLGAVTEKFGAWIPGAERIPKPYLLLSAVVLLAVTLVLQKRRWLRRSELKKPDALILRPGEHLVGREEDTDTLLHFLSSSPLVWLVGESGSGKSSLLQAGLLPALRRDATKFAVFVDDWGADWIKGPEEALADALRQAWTENFGLAGNVPTGTDGTIEQLCGLRDKMGRVPILVFDQFDDYQVRHRSKFISGRRSVLSKKALLQQNPFWQQLDQLVEQGNIRCLFATRDDAAYGLECVRFDEPQIYHLDRLRKGYVLPLLEELTTGDVVANPEAGWQQLKRHLCRDMESDGKVLPIQMRVVFRSLAGLQYLTLGEYRRQSGLRGLEAAHIGYHVSETARHAGLDAKYVRLILLAMVEPVTGKTVPVTENQLLERLGEVRDARDRLERTLDNLAAKEIVRRRIDRDTRSSVWLLDHDYLCRGILELERRASYWSHFLQEAANTFQAARGPLETWKALLSPYAQLRLLVEKLRGRVSYGNARGFASRSAIKLVLNVPVAVLLLGLYTRSYVRAQTEAGRLFAEIGVTDYSVTQGEAGALWEVSQSNYGVKRALLTAVISQEGLAARFNRRSDYVIHAVVGFDRATKDRIVRDVVSKCYGKSWLEWTSTGEACTSLAISLNPGSGETVRWILGGMKQTSDPRGRIVLGEGLAALAGSVGKEDARAASAQLLEAVKKTTDAYQLRALAEGLAALAGEVRKEDAREASAQLVKAMTWTHESKPQRALAYGLAALAAKVGEEDAHAASTELLEAVKKTSDEYGLHELVDGLLVLEGRLGEEDAHAASARLLEAVEKTTEPYALGALAQGLAALAVRVGNDDARVASAQLLEAFKKTREAYKLRGLAQGLAALAVRVGNDDARAAFAHLLQAMKNTYDLPALAEVLAVLPGKVGDEDARLVFAQLLGEMKKTSNPATLRALAHEMVAFPGNLGAEDARAAFIRVVEVAKGPSGQYGLGELAQGVEALAGKVGEEEAQAAFAQLLQAMKKSLGKSSDQGRLREVVEGLATLAGKLPAEKADQLLGAVVNLSKPVCSGLAPLVNVSLPEIVDALKWPTCASEESSVLIEKIGQAKGRAFGRKVDDRFVADEWSFADWAEREGFDLKSPSLRRPQFVQ